MNKLKGFKILFLTCISFLFITGFLIPTFTYAVPALIIKDISNSPDPFSPNGDGIEDRTIISATISVSEFRDRGPLMLIWTIRIKNSQGKLVRTFYGNKTIKNNSQVMISQNWDGKDVRGRIVPDGKYNYRIDAQLSFVRAKPGFGEVTVKTIPELSVSVSPDFWNIGIIKVNSIVTMSEVDKLTVLNDGKANATYSLCLINPQGWKASQTKPGIETYVLNAAFDKDGFINWNKTRHALSTTPVRSSSSKFASDQTGVNVKPGQKRTLWLQFNSPFATSVTAEQNIEVIVTAGLP